MKRVTVTLTQEQFDELWAEHVRTRASVASIIVMRAFNQPPKRDVLRGTPITEDARRADIAARLLPRR